MTEQYNERTELLSELHTLKNHLLGQLAEVNMAISRETNAFDAKRARTVTQQTRELLHQSQQPRPLWATPQYQQQALNQSDAKEMQTKPPYENMLQ